MLLRCKDNKYSPLLLFGLRFLNESNFSQSEGSTFSQRAEGFLCFLLCVPSLMDDPRWRAEQHVQLFLFFTSCVHGVNSRCLRLHLYRHGAGFSHSVQQGRQSNARCFTHKYTHKHLGVLNGASRRSRLLLFARVGLKLSEPVWRNVQTQRRSLSRLLTSPPVWSETR